MKLSECRSCHAPIVWTTTSNGKRMPVDADPIALPHVPERYAAPEIGMTGRQPFFGPGVDDERKALVARMTLFEKVLAEHDTAEPFQRSRCFGLRCRCGLECSSPEEAAALELHRSHVALELAKAAIA